jgi:hypothetical protein
MGIKNPSQADRRGRGKPLTALEPHMVAVEHQLRERGHAETYIAVCKRSVAHLSSWMWQEAQAAGMPGVRFAGVPGHGRSIRAWQTGRDHTTGTGLLAKPCNPYCRALTTRAQRLRGPAGGACPGVRLLSHVGIHSGNGCIHPHRLLSLGKNPKLHASGADAHRL